jgi:hypothetical protein
VFDTMELVRMIQVSSEKSALAGGMGTVKKKVLPVPGVLSAQIRPPWASMIP